MAVFTYSPSVQILIKSLTRNQVYDVSGDIVQGSVTLNQNAPHQLSVSLMNRNRRYDRFFAPDDIFVVYMKRIKKLLIMSGYLDTTPWYSSWERSVQLNGTCTSKRVLYKFWDPTTQGALTLFSKYGNTSTSADGGMRDKAMALLTEVAGWPQQTIHLASLPTSWAAKMISLYNAASPLLNTNIWSSVGGGSLIAGSNATTGTTYAAIDPPAGVPGEYYGLPTTFGQAIPYVGNTQLAANYDVQQPTTPYYCQLNWGYNLPGGSQYASQVQSWLTGQYIVVNFPDKENRSVLCQIVGSFPSNSNQDNAQNIGLSDAALNYLRPGWTINDLTYVTVAFYSGITGAPPVPGPYPLEGSATSTTGLAPTPTNNPLAMSPQTSSQGNVAAQYAEAVANKGNVPYVWGGTGPNGFDCSGLCFAAWQSAGVTIPRTTYPTSQGGQWQAPGMTPIPLANVQPGDMAYFNVPSDGGSAPQHMAMYVGPDDTGAPQMVEAGHTGENVKYITLADMESPGEILMGFQRPTGCPGYKGTGSNLAGSQNNQTSSTASSSTTTSSSSPTQFLGANTGFLTYWDYLGQGPGILGSTLTGVRGLLNDQSLLPFLNAILNASMRSWCTAPNGDWLSWFPDYFGAYGSAGILNIKDIELLDFSVAWSDQNLVTHQYVASSYLSNIFGSNPGGQVLLPNITQTDGVVTLEMGSLSFNILQTLFNLGPNDSSGFGNPQGLLNRFGARPNFQTIGAIMSQQAQFWYAMYLFQLNWAAMFTAVMPTTFMPEAYPGMLVRLEDGFQAYVQQVTHSFDLRDGGGFSTQIGIMAPSDYRNGGLYGLPAGGTTAIV